MKAFFQWIETVVKYGSKMTIIKRIYLVLTIVIITAVYREFNIHKSQQEQYTYGEDELYFKDAELKDLENSNSEPNLLNWRQISNKKRTSLSNLGKILYFDEPFPDVTSIKNFTILVWKYGASIEKRHIYHFTNKSHDPFEGCSVKNCRLTYKDEDIEKADLVIIHLHRTKALNDLPPKEKRSKQQIWTFLTDESPYHTFLQSKSKLKDFNGIFNWSMTYRMDSDIPVPYGRSTVKTTPSQVSIPNAFQEWRRKKRKDVLVAIMGSNCGGKNHRWDYVRELQKHIQVDTYGGCGTLKCPGHFKADCKKIDDYMFYLSFENSNCDEYITEKLWWNGYHKESIPIVMGASRDSYARLLPPNSYLNIDDYASPKILAEYIKYLNRTPEDLIKYFQWWKYYDIHNEHGYFNSPSYHYCRVCEALNYNDRNTKVYNDLETFWSTKDCFPRWDE